jgi:ABC-type amino acid transport substrate-binding protein
MLIHVELRNSYGLQDGHLITCILHISDRYLKGSAITVSLYSESRTVETSRVLNLSQEYGSSVVVTWNLLYKLHFGMKRQVITSFSGVEMQKYNRILHETHNKQKGYIIWVPNKVGILSHMLKNLTSYRNAWNSRARFLIIVDEVLPDPQHTAEKILKELTHFKIFNVVVLIPSRGRLPVLDLYTWFPYQLPSGHCGTIKKAVILDQWIMEGRGHFLQNVSLFPPKIPRDLGGCHITAAVVPQKPYIMSLDGDTNEGNVTYDEGSDIRLFLFTAEAMNMSVVFRPSQNTKERWPIKLENGSWTGAFGELINNKADIAFSTLALTLDRLAYFDATNVYYFSGFLWIVPCAKPFERWSSVIRVFSASMWLLLFIWIILSAGLMYGLSKCNSNITEEASSYRTISECFYSVWAIFLGVSVAQMPLTTHLKIYFVTLVWYCLAVNTVFQAFVTSYLVNPGLQKQIGSVEDLIASGIEYGFHPGVERRLPDTSDWRFKEILSHRIPIYNEACLPRVLEKKDFAILIDTMYAEYMKTYVSYDSYGKPGVCSFKQESQTKLTTMYLEKGSFLTENVNSLINVALEAGLCDFWWKNILDMSRIKAAVIARYDSMDDYTVLLLTHLQGVFYLLLLGYCLAIITFLGEILHHKLCISISPLDRKSNMDVLQTVINTGKRS